MVCSQTAGPPPLLLMLLLNAVRRGEWFGTAAGNVRHHHHHHYMETNVYRLFVDLCSTLTTLNIVVRMAAGRSSVCQTFHQCWKKDATKSGKNWTPLQGFTSAMRSTPKNSQCPKYSVKYSSQPPIRTWSGSWFLPVKRELFLPLLLVQGSGSGLL